MNAIRIEAPAKVNLRLRVLAREASGYHSLETLFCAIALCDTLWVRTAESGIHLQVEGDVDTGPPERNLVVRAARRFESELGSPLDVHLRLQKRIPSGAGLGGGSSDAAACLRALNVLHGNPLSPPTLLRLAAELGSDVPFFLCGSPLALGWSRGERLLALPPLPTRPVLVAHPGVPISTPDAFRRIAERRGSQPGPEAWGTDLATLRDWVGVAAIAANDFEPVAAELIPRLENALSALRAGGADIALLSGSGSAIFGVFPADGNGEENAARIRELGFAAWTTWTLTRTPDPQVDPPETLG